MNSNLDLEKLFKKTIKNFTCDTTHLDEIYNCIIFYYTESHRKYHNLNHLIDCIKKLNKLSNFVVDYETVLIAFFYHDIIYIPSFKDNEIASANKAKLDLRRLKLPEHFIQEVYRLISTKNIKHYADWRFKANFSIFHDIDYSILASDNRNFASYEKKLCKEYLNICTLEQFRLGRLKFLSKLQQNPIFLSTIGSKLYEQKATHNIKNSIFKILSERSIEINELSHGHSRENS